MVEEVAPSISSSFFFICAVLGIRVCRRMSLCFSCTSCFCSILYEFRHQGRWSNSSFVLLVDPDFYLHVNQLVYKTEKGCVDLILSEFRLNDPDS